MRLTGLTALVMVAFAANSVLNRVALAEGRIGAMDFALWRVASGAAALAVLVWWRDRRVVLAGPWRGTGVLALCVYMLGFSAAYLALDAGVGALILFGGVQVTMFAGAVLGRERVPALRWAGAAVALGGLAWLFWPGSGVAVPWRYGALMAAATGVMQPRYRAQGNGIYYSVFYGGMGIAPAFAGWTADAAGTASAPIYLAAAVLLATVPLFFLFVAWSARR